jgi:tetratricopeptide (TPR) repeat protein
MRSGRANRPAKVLFVALCAAIAAAPATARANPASAALRAKATAEIYNLDRDAAVESFHQAAQADPEDAAAYRGLATGLWLSITYRRGNMTVDDYLGRLQKSNGPAAPAPSDVVSEFNTAVDRAIAIARQRLAANPKDAEGHYQLGAAVGLRASYTATVEGRALGAFRSAREAYNEHEQVLSMDPTRKDAGLIVGTYRYIVAALALPVRWMAYVAGLGGDKEKGLRMIEGAAAYNGDNRPDAQFALVLLYNREQRYDDALRVLANLRENYPRNRLVWLETGSTQLRVFRWAEAASTLDEGFAKFESDRRPRMFGESAIWAYKRGFAHGSLGHDAVAAALLNEALKFEGRQWVYGRTHLELGKLAVKAGNRGKANEEFRTAAKLCDGDNDPSFADQARQLIK